MSRQASDLTLKGPNRGDGDSGNGTVRPSGRPKALLSVDEAAEMLGQSRSSLYRAIHNGEAPFPVYKIGPFRIPTVAVQRLLNGEAPPRPAN
jgi:excisionase family DNA binding protein